MSEPTALLFVFGEPGPEVTEGDFNDWYDNEHAPARVTVEGFHTTLRYKAIDSQVPKWLALYDLTSPEVMNSEGYKSLAPKASPNEKALIPRLQMLNRRLYSIASSSSAPSLRGIPGKYVLAICVDVTSSPEGKEGLSNWYEKEHLPLVSKIPGWLRGRRCELVSATELAGKADKNVPAPPKYLLIHEWDRPDFASHPTVQDTAKTPLGQRVIARQDYRSFELYRDFAATK